MRHRRSPTDTAKAVVEFLNDRHNIQLNEEDLGKALRSLRLEIVATEEPATAKVRDVDHANGETKCVDGSDECAGELTTMLDSRHVRCEKHWSTFLESEGM
jgi:hypothetical protein